MNAGAVYLNANKLDSSLMYLHRAYEHSIKSKTKYGLSYILLNLVGVQSKMGNAHLAISYYNMSLDEALKNKSARYLNLAYTGLAERYRRFNQNDSCIVYAKKAIAVV